ncbi:hypothetical protein CSB45_04440 [candidate division KSB3 bacterium]|uniref:DNA methylase adenine-specific domain-containing protein n=1 Tax=candidate division KSB3 bacterium TaxID=2044937 RepID=A0A2G6E981_9BACT|nr:MAG: hypothetical protein CSB45_04440 [candidate division KSB3 bacterium]PIE30626.1 MAG: hypothetical protein CSA57_03025 [candidate division KSB3 bacterium]
MLFLHETADIKELVEEVHEHMLKDLSEAQLQERYVEPILRGNPSFRQAEKGASVWKLTEGNKVNDSVYEVFRKYRAPLSERQVLNRLAKVEHMAGKITLTLDLKNDARFSDLEGGKYWILNEWVVVNEYARSILLKIKSGLSEKDLLARIVHEFHVDEELAVFIPKLDLRFVKKEGKWTLKRFIEQKTKLRPSRIERLYQYLLKIERALSSEELTSSVLNMPASSTDVDEKLMSDPRFVREEGLWGLRLWSEKPQELLDAEEALGISSRLSKEEDRLAEPNVDFSFDDALAEAVAEHEAETLREPEDLESPVAALSEAAPPEDEYASESEDIEEQAEESEMIEDDLRSKVIDFLQDAFQLEGVTYDADLVNQFVHSEEREEIFSRFIHDHYLNPAKGRSVTNISTIKFMGHLAEPTLNDKILDPCCGTGASLLQILETFDEQLQEAEWTERDCTLRYELRNGQFYFVQLTDEEREFFDVPLEDEVARWMPILRFCRQRQLTGVDIDRFAHRSSALAVAIQGFPEVVLHQENALTSNKLGSSAYDIVLGDPPVHGDSPISFLRRALLLAKPGGKILLLLPDDMFEYGRIKNTTLRNQLVSQTIVKAVIRMPEAEDGSRQTLLYCLRKHHDAEQESDVFIGEIDGFDGLAALVEVLEAPELSMTVTDEVIDGRVVNYILSSYQRSAYNLLLEGLRSGVLSGKVCHVNEWNQGRRLPEVENENEYVLS